MDALETNDTQTVGRKPIVPLARKMLPAQILLLEEQN